MSKKLKPFGIRELWIAPIIKDDEDGIEYGELVRAEGVQELQATPVVESFTLEGDDAVLDTQTTLEGYEVSWVNGVLTFEQMQIIENGEIEEEDDGEGNVIKRKYITSNRSLPKYFGLVGRVKGETNMKIAVLKVKAQPPEIAFQSKEYAVCSVSATAVQREFDGNMRYLITEDVPSPITIEDLQ